LHFWLAGYLRGREESVSLPADVKTTFVDVFSRGRILFYVGLCYSNQKPKQNDIIQAVVTQSVSVCAFVLKRASQNQRMYSGGSGLFVELKVCWLDWGIGLESLLTASGALLGRSHSSGPLTFTCQ